MNDQLFTVLLSVGFGLFLVIFQFPSHKKLNGSSAFVYRFIIGLVVGLSIAPIMHGAQKTIISFAMSQPDFVLSRVHRVILVLFGGLGFIFGIKAGKRKAE